MSDEGSVMDNGGNIELILTRMEGKLDRFGDRMGRFEQDIHDVRGRLHSQANDLQVLSSLGLPDRIRAADANRADFEGRMRTLENDIQQRKGALNMAKLLYGLGGIAGTAGVGIVIRLLATHTP